MYIINKQKYGVKMAFSGFIQESEMNKWLGEVKSLVPSLGKGFNVFIDIREMKTLPSESQAPMIEGHKILLENGLDKSVVILEGIVTAMQFKRLMKKAGKDKQKRYIDAASSANWETTGVKWLVDGRDPDHNTYL